jgi:D-alanine-D-alanine ligase
MRRILILRVPREKTPNLEYVSDRQVELMATALGNAGFQAKPEVFSPGLIQHTLLEYKPHLVFNLCYGYTEGNHGEALLQPDCAKLLEQLGATCVGSSASVQYVAQDKRETARALTKARVATPREISPRELDRAGIGIAKPRFGACHRGISIVRASGEFRNCVSKASQELLLQEYVSGPEYTVGVVGNGAGARVFTPVEIRFTPADRVRPHIMDWDHFRWNFVPRPDAPSELGTAALRAFRVLGFRDYGRFDFRINEGGPVLLDANALPNLDPEISLLPYMAGYDQCPFHQLVVDIAHAAHSRSHQN